MADVASFALALADAAGVEPKRRHYLELAIEEWVVNVRNHAYRGRSGELTVVVRREGKRFMVDLEDMGPPFDPLAPEPPDVTAPLEERNRGGLGIFLMRRLLDRVDYERRGDLNVVTLEVHRRS